MSERAAKAWTHPSQSVNSESLVAIIGIGAVLPGARNVSEFWQNVLEGRDSVVEVPKDRWDPAIFYDPDPAAKDKTLGKNGGFVLDLPFDTREFRIPPRTLAAMDRSQKMLLTAALEAMRDSGYHQKPFDRDRAAVVVGHAGGRTEHETAAAWTIQQPLFEEAIKERLLNAGHSNQGVETVLEEFRSRMLAGLPELTEDSLAGTMRNVAVGRIASHFDLHGPSYAVDAACASGLAALDFASDGLIHGDYDFAISGAFHAILEPMFFVGFSKFGGLSPDRVKPFDARADGFVGGEGACVFILKRLADAVRDHDRIYAVIRGVGSSSDGREKGIGAPNPVAQALAMRRAFDQAGYAPDTVQLVETHGAGTALGDVSEFEATRSVFGSRTGGRRLWLSAVKSQVGHLMGAAGAAGALKTVLGLYHKVLPPTINHVVPRKDLPWNETGFEVLTKSEPWPENGPELPRRANVSSFGFGGNNYHAAFEEYLPSFHARLLQPTERNRTSLAGRNSSGEELRQEPIAVIGVGANLPQALGIDAVWEAILNGRSGIRQVPSDRWNGKSRSYSPESGAEGFRTTSLLGGYIDPPNFDSKRFRIPPGTARGMDSQQKWFMQTALAALEDAGYANGREFDRQRTAILLGGSAGCHDNYWAGQFRPNSVRARYHLKRCESAKALGLTPEALETLEDEVERGLLTYPPISEDSLLSICVQIGAARFAKALNLMGTHCNVDAACASSLASVALAVRGLQAGKWDTVVAGGVSEGISPLPLVTFSLAGVISHHGSCPFDKSADGFVPAEGSVVFILKRLSDALEGGDKIYAVIRGIGASSDGKGRSMMAPRPEGQALCIERAYEDAGYGPETVDLVECHATATAVGDPVEVEALRQVFANVEKGRVGIGSAKSQFGHLIGAAGATGLLKAVLALHHKVLPATVNVSDINPELRLDGSPFYLLTQPKEWNKTTAESPRRAGVNAFGFGGTNWHITLEEFDRDYHEALVAASVGTPASAAGGVPGSAGFPGSAGVPPALGPQASRLPAPPAQSMMPTPQAGETPAAPVQAGRLRSQADVSPSRGTPPEPQVFAFGAGSADELKATVDRYLAQLDKHTGEGFPEPPSIPSPVPAIRLAIVAATPTDLRQKIGLIYGRLAEPKTPPVLEAQGIYLGRSETRDSDGRLCVLFPGQGPQYPDMWRELAELYPEVKATFNEANTTLRPLLGSRLEDRIFTEGGNAAEVEKHLLNSELIQPALLTANIAMYRLLLARGIKPDLLAGHSLGEYSALVAAGVLEFASALRAVHVRGREFRRMSEGEQDPGLMAMITAPVHEVEPVLKRVRGYVVIANRNCAIQTVISGASPSVREAVSSLERQGIECRILPIAGAFHSAVARAIVPAMIEVLESLEYHPPLIPVLSSVTRNYYRAEGIRRQAIGNLLAQLSGPVDFVGVVNQLYDDGARTYLEVGPKKALSGFVDDILSGRPHRTLFSNHPKVGETNQLKRLLAQLFALGYPVDPHGSSNSSARAVNEPASLPQEMVEMKPAAQGNNGRQAEISPSPSISGKSAVSAQSAADSRIVITGASAGLPGLVNRVFSDDGIIRLMNGQSLIDSLGPREQDRVVDKNITRVVKPATGESYFEKVSDRTGAIKLAARRGEFELEEFGLNQDWLREADLTDQLAVAVGLEALRDAAIPLNKAFRKTTKGTSIPNGWLLPEALQSDTAVIFGSIYTGLDKLLSEVSAYHRATLGPLAAEGLRAVYQKRIDSAGTFQEKLAADQWFSEEIQRLDLTSLNGPYEYKNELLKALNCKGNSLLAQLIKAQGPNLHMDSACASHIVALALAEDMLRAGRARRVIVIAVDDITSDNLLEWVGTGFLALGAAATDQQVCNAALPFDRRRHGLVLGMGASAVVLETEAAARERGIEPIAELLGVHVSNSASHLTRLDVDHVAAVMNRFLSRMDPIHGLSRRDLAAKTLYMSHETYTPARGGSAQAEVQGLKAAFPDGWEQVLIANTKGMTGHCQAAGIEDVVALKSLQFGLVPPVVNFGEQDPELEGLNLSRGGRQQRDFALGFAAGFGSHVAMFLARSRCRGADRIADRELNRRWLSQVTGLENPQTAVSQRKLVVHEGNGSVAPAEAPKAAPVVPLPEPVASPPAPSAPPPAATPQLDVQELVLSLFEEKTGYERAMLDLDLDLEADLGIDTIKQAQIFASVRDKYNLPREEGIRLKDFPTLRHVIDYISRRVSENPAVLAAEHGQTRTATDEHGPSVPVSVSPCPSVEVGRNVDVKELVLSLFEEKTGYEREMLDLDLDLEADLGIDTIKQAQIFASVRDKYNLPREEGVQLKDFPTLRHVIDYISRRAGEHGPARTSTDEHGPSVSVSASPCPSVEVGRDPDVQELVLSLFEEKTGYERDMLDLDLDLEADLGIDTIKQAQIFASVRDKYNLPREEGVQLKDFPTLRHVIDYISRRASENPAVLAAEHGQTRTATDEHGPSVPVSVSPCPSVEVISRDVDVQELVLSLFEEKTGYEREMLDLDLDLEADLGIDTIKQAQIFASVRDKYNLPREEGVRLKDFPTLRKVIEYIGRRLDASAQSAPAPLHELPVKWSEIKRWTVTCGPASASSGTRVQIQPGSLFLLTDDDGGFAAAIQKQLSKLGVKSVLLRDNLEDLARLQEAVKEVQRREGPIDGLIHLLPLKHAKPIEQMDLAEWRRSTAREIKSLLVLAKALLNQPAAGNRGRFFAATTSLGGRFGFPASPDETEILAGPPTHGGVAGFIKALSKEAPHFLTKVIDLSREEVLRQPDKLASTVLAEILSGDPALEVGIRDGNRAVPQISCQPVDLSDETGLELGRDSVLVLFGGARGITGVIAQDLAKRFHCRLILAGTTKLNPDFTAELAELSGEDLRRYRKQVFDEMRRQDPAVTPARAEAELQKRLRVAEIHRTLNAIRSEAAEVHYEVCDVRDPVAMARLFGDLSTRFGRLDGVVFAAGVIEDKLLEEKTEESFSRVFDVKADGAFNLYGALKSHPEMKPSFVAAFSSVAARFGNRGQADYSAGNELLAKFVHELGRLLPEASCFAVDWTAWSEVGLPARSGLAALMKEQGLDLVGPTEGAEAFYNELMFGKGSEVLYAGRLPGYADSLMRAPDPVSALSSDLPQGVAPLLDKVLDYHRGATLRAEKTIHPDTDRWLTDHIIEGVPILPGVLGIEMMVEAARLLFPDLHFVGVDDLRILLAVKILKNRPVTLKISAQGHTGRRPENRLVLVRIESEFIGPQGKRLGETRVHYDGTVILSHQQPSPQTRALPSTPDRTADRELRRNEIYGENKLLPHGPLFSVLQTMCTFDDKSAVGWVASVSEKSLCPAVNGHRLSTLPLAREAGFQVAGLWSILKPGFLSLPHGCRHLRHFGTPPENTPLLARTANFKVSGEEIECDVEIVDERGVVYDEMEGYYAVPVARIGKV